MGKQDNESFKKKEIQKDIEKSDVVPEETHDANSEAVEHESLKQEESKTDIQKEASNSRELLENDTEEMVKSVDKEKMQENTERSVISCEETWDQVIEEDNDIALKQELTEDIKKDVPCSTELHPKDIDVKSKSLIIEEIQSRTQNSNILPIETTKPALEGDEALEKEETMKDVKSSYDSEEKDNKEKNDHLKKEEIPENIKKSDTINEDVCSKDTQKKDLLEKNETS